MNDSERDLFECNLFEFQGAEMLMKTYVESYSTEYNQEHVNKIISLYLDKRKDFIKNILDLIVNAGEKVVMIKSYDYEYVEGILTVIV